MPIPQEAIDSVAMENVKVGSGAPAHYAASLMQSHAAHLSRLNIIAEQALQNAMSIQQAATAAAIRAFTSLDMVEGMANAVVGQQASKTAQTTPPPTAGT